MGVLQACAGTHLPIGDYLGGMGKDYTQVVFDRLVMLADPKMRHATKGR